MPKASEWRSIAMKHWEDAGRAERLKHPRLVMEEEKALERSELQNAISERAAKGDPFWKKLAERMAGFGRKQQIAEFQANTFDKRLEETETYLEKEQAERLARMSPEQLEARRQAVMRAYGPEKGGAVVSQAISVCDGCGKTLIKGNEAYCGPAPGKQGDSALCSVCKPNYSWSRANERE